MRILFYGGCHAAALRRIFERYAADVEYVDHLTNFRLIRDKIPVPYEAMRRFDWVIFNPILNKEEYNTVNLEKYCHSNGIKYLKYPWLQWEGYFPTMKKASWEWYNGWWYTGLDQLAAASVSFESFREDVLYGKALGDDAVQHFEVTTNLLKKNEANADLTVSSFIVDRYRDERLFLTPDHAAVALYRYIARQIAESISCKMDESFYFSNEEVQPEIQYPILPSVSKALGLRFVAGDFHNKFIFGEGGMTLTEYLKMHYYKSDIRIAIARSRTRLREDIEGSEEGRAYLFNPTDKVLIRKVHALKKGGYQSYEMMTPMKASPNLYKGMPRGSTLYFYPSHWTFTRRAAAHKDNEEKVAVSS